ncbi:MAG: ELM1/GtrOC1 family putative glycosyltransferase, partial [Candidatus Wallbacteria bacterium]|nr:ELM1/GtrOC1 family putative glycosyltransferase [Candidatus Wallbacteria bacterium]
MANSEILILSDGKPGHFHQSLGLALNLVERSQGSTINTFTMNAAPSMAGRISAFCGSPERILRQCFDDAESLMFQARRCKILIETGSSTAWAAIAIGRLFPHLKKLHILQPPFYRPFCEVLLPEHDSLWMNRPNVMRFLVGLGTVNQASIALHAGEVSLKLLRSPAGAEKGVALLIGGNSRSYRMTVEKVLPFASAFVSAGMEVLMTTSRRTPPDVGNALKQMATHPAFCLAVFVDEQPYNPLPGMLA